jgi:hypothetical protein
MEHIYLVKRTYIVSLHHLGHWWSFLGDEQCDSRKFDLSLIQSCQGLLEVLAELLKVVEKLDPTFSPSR